MWYIVLLVLFFIVSTSLIDSAFELERELEEIEEEQELLKDERKGGYYDDERYS